MISLGLKAVDTMGKICHCVPALRVGLFKQQLMQSRDIKNL